MDYGKRIPGFGKLWTDKHPFDFSDCTGKCTKWERLAGDGIGLGFDGKPDGVTNGSEHRLFPFGRLFDESAWNLLAAILQRFGVGFVSHRRAKWRGLFAFDADRDNLHK
jgi:hypothetical protein